VDVEIGKVGKKIIPNEDSKENEIIDDPFEIIFEWNHFSDVLELQIEVFAQQ
jgi:hypothetical protein